MAKSEINTASRTIKMESITPALAEEYLDTMPHNRRTRQRVINDLVGAIKGNSWFPTIEPIHFDEAGALRNGQHRMWAIVETGKTLDVLVVRGATEEEIDAIDTGSPRLTGDVLTLRHGMAEGDVVATVLKHLWSLNQGGIPTGGGGGLRRRGAPNNHQMAQYYLEHPHLLASVRYVNETPIVRKMGPRGTMALCHYLISQAGGVRAQEFWHCLAQAIYVGNNDPVYRLRERLTKAKNAGTPRGGAKSDKLDVTEMSALIIKAWNAWVTNTPVQLLRWQRFGDRAEMYPTPWAMSHEA